MNINATLLGEMMAIIFVVCVPLFAWMSYRLGKRKTTTPKTAAIVGGLLGIIPILGLLFIAVLVLKNDVEAKTSSV